MFVYKSLGALLKLLFMIFFLWYKTELITLDM